MMGARIITYDIAQMNIRGYPIYVMGVNNRRVAVLYDGACSCCSRISTMASPVSQTNIDICYSKIRLNPGLWDPVTTYYRDR